MNADRAFAAYEACVNAGINMHLDYYALRYDENVRLAELARAFKYRKPRGANGSTARYFFAYVNKGRDAANRA
jgi:hypothetical protein